MPRAVQSKKKLQGFAAMSPKKRLNAQKKGAKAIHKLGLAHQWTSKEARKARSRVGTRHAGKG